MPYTLANEQLTALFTHCDSNGVSVHDSWYTAPPKVVKESHVRELKADSLFNFGKYRWYAVGEILTLDPSYIIWVSKTVERYTIEPTLLADAELLADIRGC